MSRLRHQVVTTLQRQYIINTAFAAIKAAFGDQEKLSLLGYSNVEYDSSDIKSGTFFLSAVNGRFYRVTLGVNGVTGLKRGGVNVSFD